MVHVPLVAEKYKSLDVAFEELCGRNGSPLLVVAFDDQTRSTNTMGVFSRWILGWRLSPADTRMIPIGSADKYLKKEGTIR